MELSRQHAKEAIKLVKRQKAGGHEQTDSDVIEVCTKLALGLQEGKLPAELYASFLASSKKTSRSREHSTSSSVTIVGDEDDETNETSATDGKETSIATSSPTSTRKTNSEQDLPSSRSRTPSILSSYGQSRKNSHVTISELSLTPPRSRSPSPSPRIPSCGLITTRSPASRPATSSLALPPILTHRHLLTRIGSAEIKKKQPLTAVKVTDSEKFPKQRRKEKRKGKQKIKAFPKQKQTEMDVSEIMSDHYWIVPFDPLRQDVLSDHTICDLRKTEYEEEEEEVLLNEKDVLTDVAYWEIQKILRFIRIGNPTATVLALCALKEMDLTKPLYKEIIYLLNGIPLLLNILDTNNHRCRVAALKVLVLIASSKKISNIILRKSGIKQLVSILDENDNIVVSLVCDVLSLLAKHSTVRMVANKLEIIPKLMTVFQRCVKETVQEDKLTLCQSVCCCLWSCSNSIRQQDVSCVSESLPVISKLVDSRNESLVVPLLGLVEECASTDYFRCKMEKEYFIEKVTKKVGDSQLVVQVLCFKILFKCAGDRRSQKTLVKSNSLQQLVNLLKENIQEIKDELLILLLGIIWRCSVNEKHRKKFANLDIFPFLIDILKSNKSLEVKSATLGVLSEFLWDNCYTQSAVHHDVVHVLMTFMSSTEPSVLVNSARSLGVCARNSSWRGEILKLDGLRLLWSLLKRHNEQVLTSGAVAVASVCACPEESATAVRSIVGGVELLMSLLSNTELTKDNILISLCETAMNIVQDAENRSILMDYGLVPVVLRLCENKNKILRYYVTRLISRCSEVKSERSALSKCVPFLVEGLGDDYDEHVHCASICALCELSCDFSNCAFLTENQTKKTMLNMLGSSNERIQDAAAGCLANVRKSMTATSYVKV